MTDKAPTHAKLALALALLLPVYLMAAALGTKFGLWDWRFGLMTLFGAVTPFLLGIVGLLAVVSLVLIVRRKPRDGWWMPVLALAVPLGIVGFGFLLMSQAQAVPPIHDVATDADAPTFSPEMLAAREAVGANPVIDYQTRLGELEPYQSDRFANLADKTLAEVNAENYGDLAALPIGSATPEQAAEAVVAAMEDMGGEGVRAQGGRIEGTFETFWFGFRDDVVARVDDGEIDFRSVSRVGLGDIGKNAERIRELRAKTVARLGS